MIEQVPSVIYVASLARTQRIRTSVGLYSIHHLAPELFDGFETRPDGAKLATPEKALFDIAYFSGGRSRMFTHLPELELVPGFRRMKLNQWIARAVSMEVQVAAATVCVFVLPQSAGARVPLHPANLRRVD